MSSVEKLCAKCGDSFTVPYRQGHNRRRYCDSCHWVPCADCDTLIWHHNNRCAPCHAAYASNIRWGVTV